MSNVSHPHTVYHCTDSPTAVLISFYYTVVKYSMVFPLSVFVLYHAYQQWLPRRSFQIASHLDFLTYHMAILELLGSAGAVFYSWGVHGDVKPVLLLGVFLVLFCFVGQVLVHCFTCVDRYIAVVHPITYRKSRQNTGIKIRNVGILFIWLSGITTIIIQVYYANRFPTIPFVGLLLSASILVSFCSISVLKALIRPGPSDISNDRVNKAKRKAFNTITAILVTLCFSFAAFIVCMAFTISSGTSYDDQCIIFASGLWVNIPSSLVLPLMFLQRTGKLKFKLLKC